MDRLWRRLSVDGDTERRLKLDMMSVVAALRKMQVGDKPFDKPERRVNTLGQRYLVS
ncbi:hypothetical protein Pla100_45410 [Neorhodopirellula pilleata]|uniref:Uncharacterized protein n=1 Tax=Neorhodopirellula pilleata TaxID=2714738 RepID=A0A5C6A1Z5_9BACT|nr:hypothetical protein Pla100_45410 [Neorhodopirellula pilleata]